MLSVEVDNDLYEEVQTLWPLDGRKRWEFIQELLQLGLVQYKADPKNHRPGQHELPMAG